MELAIQRGVAERALQRPDGVFNKKVHAAPVAQHGRHVHRRFIDAVVHGGHHLAAQRDHVGAVDDGVFKFFLASAAKNQTRSAAVVHAELGLQAVGGFLFARQLQYQRVHFEFDVLHLIGADALLAQLHTGVNRGVDDDAASKGLVGVERDLELLAQAHGGFVPVVLGGHHLHEATWRFQSTRAGRKTLLRHQGRHQPCACRSTRVQWFAHAAKLLAQTHGLRRRNANGHLRLLFVQAQHACTTGSGAQHAGAAGDVPATVVVRWVHDVAHAARDINAQHQGVDQCTATGTFQLGQRKQGRSHGASRVDDGFEVGVVEVKSVR